LKDIYAVSYDHKKSFMTNPDSPGNVTIKWVCIISNSCAFISIILLHFS